VPSSAAAWAAPPRPALPTSALALARQELEHRSAEAVEQRLAAGLTAQPAPIPPETSFETRRRRCRFWMVRHDY